MSSPSHAVAGRLVFSDRTDRNGAIVDAIEQLLDLSTNIAVTDRILLAWAARELVELCNAPNH